MTDVKISDLILHSVEQKPVDFNDTFNALLKDRLAAAVEVKREQVAKTLFNPVDNETEDDEEVDNDSDSYDEQEIESEEETNG